eukprot:TRINITY_DN16544_c0_g1_i1.p1 TRINITY_DN16544_c0_g1~~TRINITY_DN16544_c0_g1_i1.p1  ORF type:complete len:344 (+),score=61.86 TRINITY_DN16544_c0_g1_i1:104-1135(+)
MSQIRMLKWFKPGNRLMPVHRSWNTEALNFDRSSFMNKKTRLAEGLASRTDGRAPLKAKGLIRFIDRHKQMHRMGYFSLESRMDMIHKRVEAKVTDFERILMSEVADAEIDERNKMHRKRTDTPLMDENPYSVAFDYRMGSRTPLPDTTPIIATRMRFISEKEVADAISKIARRYPTIGDILQLLELDTQGKATGALLDKHGEVFRHLELFCRCVAAQEGMRQHVARRNLQGQLTTEANGNRVYALPGCYRLSKAASVNHHPGFSSPGLVDPGSYGAWGWYNSDFGTDPSLLQNRDNSYTLAKVRGGDHFENRSYRGQYTRNIHGGRNLSKKPVGRHASGVSK